MNTNDPVAELARCNDARWDHITKAASAAAHQRAELITRISERHEHLLAQSSEQEMEVVVFGSLGRDEWTSGSDVDWTLLIDGRADLEHFHAANVVGQAIDENRKPGAAGIFGNMAFSHEIIHRIGGHEDTNRNITQRVLLLLEGRPLARQDAGHHGPYGRVVSTILERYLQSGSQECRDSEWKPPRFLINDLVRYWRTMCVDFAWKEWERDSEKWGTRNIKLRMSRKLIFAAGLLACLEPSVQSGANYSLNQHEGRERLFANFSQTPLRLMAQFLLDNGNGEQGDPLARKLFGKYDEFLGALDDTDTRKVLDKAAPSKQTEVYRDCKKLSDEFQDALVELFFERNELSSLVREYGVF